MRAESSSRRVRTAVLGASVRIPGSRPRPEVWLRYRRRDAALAPGLTEAVHPRLLTLSTTGDAGANDWAATPDPLTELVSAEATLAIVQRTLRSVTVADTDLQTPCADFTVAQLTDHLIGSITGVGAALGITVTDRPDAAPEVRVADAAQPTLEAFQVRGLEGTIDMGFAELPATMVANILNLEFLVQAWDFATATGP